MNMCAIMCSAYVHVHVPGNQTLAFAGVQRMDGGLDRWSCPQSYRLMSSVHLRVRAGPPRKCH